MLTSTEIRKEVESGNRSALSAAILMKRMMVAIDEDYEAVRGLAKREHDDKWGSKEVVIDGATITKNAGGRYGYKGIDKWERAKKKLSEIEKDAQDAYKAIRDSGEQPVDKETGEIIQPAEYIPNTETIAIKL